MEALVKLDADSTKEFLKLVAQDKINKMFEIDLPRMFTEVIDDYFESTIIPKLKEAVDSWVMRNIVEEAVNKTLNKLDNEVKSKYHSELNKMYKEYYREARERLKEAMIELNKLNTGNTLTDLSEMLKSYIQEEVYCYFKGE